MRSELIGVVARFRKAKRRVFEEVDLKHLILSQAKLLTTCFDYLQRLSFYLLHISAMFFPFLARF